MKRIVLKTKRMVFKTVEMWYCSRKLKVISVLALIIIALFSMIALAVARTSTPVMKEVTNKGLNPLCVLDFCGSYRPPFI